MVGVQQAALPLKANRRPKGRTFQPRHPRPIGHGIMLAAGMGQSAQNAQRTLGRAFRQGAAQHKGHRQSARLMAQHQKGVDTNRHPVTVHPRQPNQPRRT